MNTQGMITLLITLLLSVGSIMMLRYEWIRLAQKEGNRAEQESYLPLPKWMLVYGAIVIIAQLSMAVMLLNIYDTETVCMYLKRLGLLALIWQAAALDWKYNKIPNDIIIAGLGMRIILLIAEFITEREQVIATLISEGIALAAIVIIIVLCLILMKNSIGMGDLKLMMLMAICQGVSGLMISAFFSLCVSFIEAIFLLLTKKKSRKDTLPFAPCILLGTLIGVFLTGL